MKTKPRILQGFMELLPKDQILFNEMMDQIRRVYESFGYLPLDTPILEYSDVLLAKAGGETEKQIYRFNKGDNDLSMRFDLTVPLARFVSMNAPNLVFPFKRYQLGKVYRGERPQKGRFREFYQCDIDVIGDEILTPLYDAEIPAVIYQIFTGFKLGKFTIRINNRKVLNGFMNSLNLSCKTADILRVIDKIEKISSRDLNIELKNLNVTNKDVDQILSFINTKGSNAEIIKKLKALKIDNEMFSEGINELELVINGIKSFNIPEEYLRIDLSIARGLDYYTGTVYETKLDSNPEIGSICSGGRYDDLAGYYTDKKYPGVGISIGLTRLFFVLKEKGLINNETNTLTKVVIIPMDNTNLDYALKLATYLRDCDINSDINFIAKGIKQKIKYADRLGVKYIAIIGEDEEKNNTVTIKNMLNGEQKTVSFDNSAKIIKE